MDSNILMIIIGCLFSVAMIFFTLITNKNEHPKALFMLFMTEMWERFSFYGMRALLVLYMTSQLFMPDAEANKTYGSYMALVYAMPLLGGMIADKYLGFRKAILFGGVLMAMGHLVLALPSENFFYLGLAFIVAGNGFFKPNISSMVGKFYGPNDPKRDAGFSIFYMGINIGALMGSLICGYLGQKVSWHLGFGIAGIFMVLGLVVFILRIHVLGKEGLPPDEQLLKQKSFFGINIEKSIYLGSLLLVPAVVFLIQEHELMGKLFNPLGIIILVYLLYLAYKHGRVEGQRMLAAIIMIFLSIIFWAFFEQGGGSLNLFADRNVDMMIGETQLSSAAVNNSANPFFIILLSPIIAMLWVWLSKKKMEPNIPVKFGLAFLLLGLGFYTFVFGGSVGAETGFVSLTYFLLGYMLISTGELCISPIGLSMVTKLSPANIVGFIMGAWFLASAFGQYVAGLIGAWMAIPTVDGTSALPPQDSLLVYTGVYYQIAVVSIVSGVVILVISPFIKKWMHGVK